MNDKLKQADAATDSALTKSGAIAGKVLAAIIASRFSLAMVGAGALGAVVVFTTVGKGLLC